MDRAKRRKTESDTAEDDQPRDDNEFNKDEVLRTFDQINYDFEILGRSTEMNVLILIQKSLLILYLDTTIVLLWLHSKWERKRHLSEWKSRNRKNTMYEESTESAAWLGTIRMLSTLHMTVLDAFLERIHLWCHLVECDDLYHKRCMPQFSTMLLCSIDDLWDSCKQIDDRIHSIKRCQGVGFQLFHRRAQEEPLLVSVLSKPLIPSSILCIDEIDNLLHFRDSEDLYRFFELPFISVSHLILVGISNTVDLIETNLPLLKTKNCISTQFVMIHSVSTKDRGIQELLEGRPFEHHSAASRALLFLITSRLSAVHSSSTSIVLSKSRIFSILKTHTLGTIWRC